MAQVNAREDTGWTSLFGADDAIDARYRRGVLRARAVVANLTCSSGRLQVMEQLRPGMTLWLALPGIEPLQATVVETDGFVAELRFERPLHPAVCAAVRAGQTGRLH